MKKKRKGKKEKDLKKINILILLIFLFHLTLPMLAKNLVFFSKNSNKLIMCLSWYGAYLVCVFWVALLVFCWHNLIKSFSTFEAILAFGSLSFSKIYKMQIMISLLFFDGIISLDKWFNISILDFCFWFSMKTGSEFKIERYSGKRISYIWNSYYCYCC